MGSVFRIGIGKTNDALDKRLKSIERVLARYREENIIVFREEGRSRRCTALVTGDGTANLNLGSILPFTASRDADGNISALGGAYQVGADGAWVSVPATVAAAGDFLYFIIEQDTSYAVTSVTTSVEAAALDAVVEVGSPVTGYISNVLVAEVVDDLLIQRRHGNFTLGLWQIDGYVARWTETLAGSIPVIP